MVLPAPFAAAAPGIALALTGKRAGIELFLQIAERLIRQALLFAQDAGQILQRLFACAPPAGAGAVCHAQIFHHLPELTHQFFGLGKAALLDQLLNAVHHFPKILPGQHPAFALTGFIGGRLRVLRKPAHVIPARRCATPA